MALMSLCKIAQVASSVAWCGGGGKKAPLDITPSPEIKSATLLVAVSEECATYKITPGFREIKEGNNATIILQVVGP